MQLHLEEKRVLVTAGASGIGRAVVEAFVREGARVATCDIAVDAVQDMKRQLPEVFGRHCDVADTEAVRRFVADAAADFGGIDVLVNNAGIAGPTGAAQDIALEDWKRTLDVNLAAMFDVTRHAIPHLVRSGGGAIVNLSLRRCSTPVPMGVRHWWRRSAKRR